MFIAIKVSSLPHSVFFDTEIETETFSEGAFK